MEDIMDSEFMVSWRTYREPGQGRPGDQDGKIVRSRGAEQRGDSIGRSKKRRRTEDEEDRRLDGRCEEEQAISCVSLTPRLQRSMPKAQPNIFFGCVVIEV